MESGLGNEPFDWSFSLPPQPVHPSLQGAGAVCETKRFDSFYNASGDRVVLPAGQRYSGRKDRAYESALSVTTFWDRHQNLEKTVLDIKSPHMKAALKAVVPKYHSFNIDARHITITDEPRCLFQYRDELLNYGLTLQQQGQDAEAVQHVQHLISYMWDVFAVEILAFNTFEWLVDVEPSLEHKYLWMIFRPGDLVYVREPHRRAFLFEEMTRDGDSWDVSGYCIDYDGDLFGYRKIRTTISSYDGLKPLTELDTVHFDRLPADEKQTVKAQLMAQGRKFVGIHGQQCLWYNAKTDRSLGGKMKTRIMADYKGYINWGPGLRIWFSAEKKKFKPEDVLEQMTELDLMICQTFVAGYSLRNNNWGTFDIESIDEITFDSEAFDALILPDDLKQQILSLVRVHEDQSFSFDDLVKGKGRGMAFLLYGDPGVGKTLTAESVADYCKKPLLRLDAGTLGTSAYSVEKGLKDAFNLAERWHALLLLDEADVYLEQRKSKNLVHNGIVSVFLRMLEYYHGILFLTTNRITSFDRAFISRIHLAIHYPPLSQSSRRELLYTFLKQTSEESAEALGRRGVLEKIAEEKLNGRQIKNLVRTACALALSDVSARGQVDRRHIELALRPMKQFEQSMEQILLRDEQQDLGKEADDEEEQIEDQPAYSEDSEVDEDEEEENTDLDAESGTEVEVEIEEEVDTEEDESEEEEVEDDEESERQLAKRRRLV
ncbi:hypothetical protein NM208_g11042 [Fusarium decemcellulare]|uniref:Uncharacterized protein n=1 Tax=Fusarium decemcellulare TaxID=57161 RepID=A0ACC1RVR1_9HYPO|nr:hypothetical protein NM208_g11042 [Fusarium decemcellulare]